MIHVTGSGVEVSGAMTLREAAQLLAAGCAAITHPEVVFDLSAVTAVDSSGIAVIFGWLREARRHGRNIRVTHVPQDLLNLASVYDVTGLLPIA